MTTGLILPSAILFDMDGTLTEPLLDFPRIKAEMDIGERPILEALAEMSGAQRARAEAVLRRHEEDAAERSTLAAGCHRLLDWLRTRRVKLALITRNSRSSVKTVLRRHRLAIDELITRDDAPPKPDPAPLHLACARLAVPEADAWMVGDGVYDIEAAARAGIRSIWISHGRTRAFAATPWKTVAGLTELHAVLHSCSAHHKSGQVLG